MDGRPIFLKRIRKDFGLSKGATLIEVVVVATIIGLLAVLILVALNSNQQLAKSKDARRKSDLDKIKKVLEDYYNDYQVYPLNLNCGDSLTPYLERIPCDPNYPNDSYLYLKDGNAYWLYTRLENKNDPAITKLGCQNGCGPVGNCEFNYAVTSENVKPRQCSNH